MKKTFNALSAALLAALICLTAAVPALAASSDEIPYNSYTYWEGINENKRKAVYNRPMYETAGVLTADSLKVSAFTKLNDVCTDENGNAYILDDASRITVLDKDYNLIKEIGALNKDGEKYEYAGANSLYVDTDGTIYICDTENARVLHCTADGVLTDILKLPDSPLIPKDYKYRPMHIVADSRNYLYVLSDGSYYGMILYAADRSFLGFYGANEVTNGIMGALKNVWNRLFVSNEKKSNTARTLPYVFVDVARGGDGFIYTATGYTDKTGNKGQIKKLSPGTGKNILESEDINFTDDEENTTYKDGETLNQNIVALEVDKNGYIYCLDASFGRVFLYDSEKRMLSAFGSGMGSGTQKGSFTQASALALNGGDVLVTDSTKCILTVFRETDYGARVKELRTLSINGDYTAAKEGWLEVIKEDSGCQTAYSGLARAYLAENDYDTAMEYAKNGYDRETYALAFELSRRDFIYGNFPVIFAVIIIMLCAIAALIVLKRRKAPETVKDSETRLLFRTLIHPSLCFDEVKEKGRGSIKLCIAVTAVYYVLSVMQTLCGGFLFTYYDSESFNSIMVLVRSVGIVVLWIICNWMVCTLLGGKGKIREIAVVTCYSLIPLIIEMALRLLLTNVLLPTEGEFLGIFETVAMLYTLLILIIGMIKIHDFSMSRFIGTGILSVAGIAAVVFLAVMVGMLLQQLAGFIGTVFMELTL